MRNVSKESSFQGLLKTCNLSLLSIQDTEKNVPSHYLKVTQGTLRNPEIFVNIYLLLSLSMFQQPYYC